MYLRPAVSIVLFVLCFSSLDWSQNSNQAIPPRNGGDFSSGDSSNNAQPLNKVPAGVILVKGAWSSASDSSTPVPEGGGLKNSVYTNQYFGITYPLPVDWEQKYEGPPPSDTGRYVLAQFGSYRQVQRPRTRNDFNYSGGHVFYRLAGEECARTRQFFAKASAVGLPSRDAAHHDQNCGASVHIFCLLVAGSGAALVCSGHGNSLPRGENRTQQPRHEIAGKSHTRFEQHEIAGPSESDGGDGRRRLSGLHQGLREQREPAHARRSDFYPASLQSGAGANHYRYRGQDQAHSLSQRVSRPGEGDRRCAGAVEIQTVCSKRKARRGGDWNLVRKCHDSV